MPCSGGHLHSAVWFPDNLQHPADAFPRNKPDWVPFFCLSVNSLNQSVLRISLSNNIVNKIFWRSSHNLRIICNIAVRNTPWLVWFCSGCMPYGLQPPSADGYTSFHYQRTLYWIPCYRQLHSHIHSHHNYEAEYGWLISCCIKYISVIINRDCCICIDHFLYYNFVFLQGFHAWDSLLHISNFHDFFQFFLMST